MNGITKETQTTMLVVQNVNQASRCKNMTKEKSDQILTELRRLKLVRDCIEAAMKAHKKENKLDVEHPYYLVSQSYSYQEFKYLKDCFDEEISSKKEKGESGKTPNSK